MTILGFSLPPDSGEKIGLGKNTFKIECLKLKLLLNKI